MQSTSEPDSIPLKSAVTIRCPPGHSGVSGNPIVDKLPREVSKNNFEGPERSITVSSSVLKEFIVENKIFNKHWISLD